MQLINKYLEKVDIYSPARENSDYIGTKSAPKLLGYVYADIQPVTEEIVGNESGKTVKSKVKLILRADAGVKCGDLAAISSKTPDWEITEVKQFTDHISATAVHL